MEDEAEERVQRKQRAKPKKWRSGKRRRSRRMGMAKAEGEAEERAWREQRAKPKKQMKDYMD